MFKIFFALCSTFEDVLAALAVPGVPEDGQEAGAVQQLLQLPLGTKEKTVDRYVTRPAAPVRSSHEEK